MIYKSAMHIAFLGPKGSYSHIAAMLYANRYLKKIIECSCKKFNDIFSLVECNYAEYGIVPIENSNSGLIDEICNLLLDTRALLVDEITIPIKHCVLVRKHVNDINNIQTIYSHPQPVQQCSKFLTNFSTWKIVLCESSAVAMKTVAQSNQSNLAALGSVQGGRLYGLHTLLTHNLSNSQKNATRFVILKNESIEIIDKSIAVKTILSISIGQQSKKLCEILEILRYYNIKVTYFKSRLLLHNTLKNIIIIEIIAHIYNIYIQQVLTELQKISHSLKILGCYPIRSNINIINNRHKKIIKKSYQ